MSNPVTTVYVWLKSQSENKSGEFRYSSTWSRTPVDPLDVEYDGYALRILLEMEEYSRLEGKTGKAVQWAMAGGWRCASPLQRSAVSAHWSAELRRRAGG